MEFVGAMSLRTLGQTMDPRYGRGDDVVRRVFERPVLSLHIGVHKPELAAVVRQARRPHTLHIDVRVQLNGIKVTTYRNCRGCDEQ